MYASYLLDMFCVFSCVSFVSFSNSVLIAENGGGYGIIDICVKDVVWTEHQTGHISIFFSIVAM